MDTPSPRPALPSFTFAILWALASLIARAPAQREPAAPVAAAVAPPSPIHLCVGDALDQAIAAAAVTLLDAAGRELRRGITDAVGFFSFTDAPRGPVQVRVSAAGFATRQVAVDAPRQAHTQLLVHLGDAATVRGLVTDADERPVAGAEVLAFQADDLAPAPRSTTDASGAFLLTAVPLGPVILRVGARDFLLQQRQLRVVGDTSATFQLQPGAGSSFRLRARGDDATALAKVSVRFTAGRDLGGGPLPSPLLRTGADAVDAVAQVVGLPRGDALQVAFVDPGATWVTKSERRFADATRLPDADLDIALSSTDGHPLGGVDLRFMFNSEPLRAVVARSDASGHVRIRCPKCLVQISPDGPEWLFALPERPGMFDREDRVHHVPDGGPLQLRLVPTMAITGRVLDPNHRPLARAPVFVQGAVGHPRRLLSDGNGAFALRVPARGEHDPLTVWIGRSPTAEVTVAAREASRAGVTLVADPQRYEFEVVDSAGAPCPGERIGIPLHVANPLALLRETEFLITNRQGRARRTVFHRVESVIHESGFVGIKETLGATGERRVRIDVPR